MRINDCAGLARRLWGGLRSALGGPVRLIVWPPPSPWLPVCIYGPLAIGGIIWGYAGNLPVWACFGLFLAGLLLWTLLEYAIHSLAFHHTIRFLRLQSVQASHTRHHEQPTDPRHMVGQLSFTLPVAIVVATCLFFALGSSAATALVMSGVLVGYLAYEVIHFQIHLRRKSRWLPRGLVKHHMYHHYKDQARCYGVTMPLWDWVFGTNPRSLGQRTGAGL